MAKLYGEIAKSALLTLDKSFSRALGQPLDASEVYYSLETAKTYAATPAAYVGQKIVVIENGKVTHYSVEDAAGTLKEVGVRPTGDGKSITVSAEGVVSILGMAGADSLTLPRMKEDKSGIEWVPVSQVVEGDGNDNTTYTFTELTKGEGDAAETYGFVVKTFFNGTEVEGGSIEIAFDVYTKSEADAKFLAKADYTPYDETALANRVKAVEDNKADKADTYTKTDVDTAISNAVQGILGDDIKEAYDTLVEIQAILEGTDGEAIDGLIETAADNKAKIEVLNGDVNTTGSVAKQIADAIAPYATAQQLEEVRQLADAAQTADEVATAITTALTVLEQYAKVSDLEAYYTAEQIDNKGYAVATDVERDYAKKATTLAGYGITDAYTATETDNAIRAKIQEMTGGESAADVLGLLNDYKASNDREVWGDQFVTDNTVDGKYEPTYTGESRVDKLANRALALEEKVGHDVNGEEPATGLFLEVDEARAQADKGVEDAAKAAQAVTQLANGQVATNKANIENLAILVGAIGDEGNDTLAGKIGALEAHDQAHAIEFSTLSGKVDQNIIDIGKKANSADVYTKGEVDAIANAKANATEVYKKTEIYSQSEIAALLAAYAKEETVNAELAKKLEAADLAPYAKTEDVAKTYATIAALECIYKAGEGETEATGILAEEIARAKAAEKKLSDDLAILINNPTEDLDSVVEIIEHVKNNGTAVTGIIGRLDGHDTLLAGMGGEGQPATVLAAIQEAAYELPAATKEALGGVKLSDEVGANADGQLEIKTLSTDKLVNGEMTLVLNGGNANA